MDVGRCHARRARGWKGGVVLNYPTLEEVEYAGRLQLARWYRFLPSPGSSAVGSEAFELVCQREQKIMAQIILRLHNGGGMTPSLSKLVGWDGEGVSP